MVVVFCVSNFIPEKLRLQPWLTIYRVGLDYCEAGHRVVVITDTGSNESLDGIEVVSVPTLRGSASAHIEQLLSGLQPDRVFVAVTPLSLATSGWFSALQQYDAYAFLSYAFYTPLEIIKAMPHIANSDRISYGRHIVVPQFLWAKRLQRCFKGALCQSDNTRLRISTATEANFPVHFIPPGTDKEQWNLDGKSTAIGRKDKSFLFLGSPYGIRGFYLLLDAIQQTRSSDVRLRLLARGAEGEALVALRQEIEKRGIRDKVVIRGGWLDIASLKEEIQAARAVVLPFILVPSELPVTVYESIGCGTPVIGSNIDGLPSSIDRAGVIFPQADVKALANAIDQIAENDSLLATLEQASVEQSHRLKSWHEVTMQWMALTGAGS